LYLFCRSSPSRVVGGRWLRQVRQVSHSRQNRHNVTSPLPHSTNRHSSGQSRADFEPHVELRRSSRLINSLPRSDYSITERWSYGVDVYETRCDTADFKSGDADKAATAPYTKRARTSSHDRKKRKSHSISNSTDECVAYYTRSRTALKSTESVCEHIPTSLKVQTLTTLSVTQDVPDTPTQQLPLNHSEGGLLPLEDRDFAYSPFSSSTVTELLDSDYSVYSPTTTRRKGKKRKRSSHRSLSSRKNNCLLNLEECRKKFKIDPHGKDFIDTFKDTFESRIPKQETEKVDQATASFNSCAYSLRNRNHRDLGPSTSTVICDNTGN
jgi:hypothetical protein